MKKNQVPVAPTAAPRSFRLPDWAWLAVALGVLVLLRVGYLALPLERDEATYAYLGKRLLEGQVPYVDFYEMKPPMMFVSFAAIVAVFGYSQMGLHVAALFFSAVNAALVFAIGRRLYTAPRAWVACMAYVLFACNPYTTAVLMESELLVTAWVLGATWVLLRWRTDEARQPRWLLPAGAMLSLAILTKQTGVLFGLVPAVVLLSNFFEKKPRHLVGLLRSSAWLLAGLAVPMLACWAWLAAVGATDEFWFWNVTYIGRYQQANADIPIWNIFWFNFDLFTQNFDAFWVLGGLGLVGLVYPSPAGWKRLTVAALAVAGAWAIFPGNRFYGHYWLHVLPALALLIGHGYHVLHTALAARGIGWVAGLVVLVSMSIPVAQTAYEWSSPKLARTINAMFPGNPYAEDAVLADFLKKRIQPNDEVAVLGTEPQVYVYLDRKAPSKHFYAAILSRPMPESEAMQREALDSLFRQKPKYIVLPVVRYSWGLKEKSVRMYYEGAWAYCRERYQPIAVAEFKTGVPAKYILDPTVAATYRPTTEQYIQVLERIEK
jgi:hypothetical protein